MLSRWGCVAAVCLGLASPAEAGERSGLVHRASCAVVRFYVAKFSAYAAEAWDPATNSWTTLASNTVFRGYHSVALLMPDGRVWMGGGNKQANWSFHDANAYPGSLPKARQGLGESQPKGARVLAPRLNPPHAQKTLQSSVKSPDGL